MRHVLTMLLLVATCGFSSHAEEAADSVQSASQARHFNALGYDLYVLGEHDEAINMYLKALDFEWNRKAVVYNNLGAAYYARKDYDEALRCYQKAVDLDATYSKAKVNVAAAHFRLRHYWRAAHALRGVQQQDPKYVHRRLKPDKVREELNAENERNPGNPFLLQLVSLADERVVESTPSLIQSPEVQTVAAAVNEHFAKLSTFSARVVRNTQSPQGTARQEWKVLLRLPDQIRVEWLGPQPMTFITSGTEAWYYTPAEKKAVHVPKVDPESLPKMDLGLNVLPEYIQTHLFKISEDSPEGQWLLVGRPTSTSERVAEVRLWIDQSSKCLLRSELYDREGQIRVKTLYTRFRDCEQGLQLPGKCTILSYDRGACLESEMTFLELRANVPVQDENFRFLPPDGVEVQEQD